MILFTSLYEPDNKQRENELIECIERNYNSDLFKRIVVLFEGYKGAVWEAVNKLDIHIVTISSRPDYDMFFYLVNNDYQDKIVVIANADIYFDDTIKLIEPIDLDNKLVVLTRYNKHGDTIGFQTWEKKTACADVWIFKSPITIKCDYQLGIPYCDGKISMIAFKSGMKVVNLSRDIKTIHIHDKQYRNLERTNYKYKGKSLFIHIQKIKDTNVPEPDLRND